MLSHTRRDRRNEMAAVGTAQTAKTKANPIARVAVWVTAKLIAFLEADQSLGSAVNKRGSFR